MSIRQTLRKYEPHITETLLTAFIMSGATHYLLPVEFNIFLNEPLNVIPDIFYWVIFFSAVFWIILPKRVREQDDQMSLDSYYDTTGSHGVKIIKRFGVHWKVFKGAHDSNNRHSFEHVEGPFCRICDHSMIKTKKKGLSGAESHFWKCEHCNTSVKRKHYPNEIEILTPGSSD